MTEKRFKHMLNRLGMQFICYDDMEVLLGTFADKDGVNHIVNKLNELSDENEQLKLICKDHRNHANDFKADCVRLEKENEQLKHDATVLIQANQDYRRENEQLKGEVAHYKLILMSLEEQAKRISSIRSFKND